MKGMIEVHFPSTGEGIGLEQGWKGSLRNGRGKWLDASVPAQAVSKFAGFPKKIQVGEYLELLRQENLLRRLSPYWNQFSPSRVCLRLHEDWIDQVQHARSIIRMLTNSSEPHASSNGWGKEILSEVIIPAGKVSRIHKRSEILQLPLVTISDLYSHTPCMDWSLSEGFARMAQEHKLLGLEFAFTGTEKDRELLRHQLKMTSLMRPAFVRFVQPPEVSKGVFLDVTAHDRGLMKKLSLALEAFAALGFEIAAASSQAVVLSSQPDLNWNHLATPGKVLGLGVGARSRRADAAGRTVSSLNPGNFPEYRKLIKRLWKQKEAIQKAYSVPYLHKAIERGLCSHGGLSYDTIREIFGVDLEKIHPGLTSVLKEAGLVEQSADRLVLTSKAQGDPHSVVRNFFLGEKEIGLRG